MKRALVIAIIIYSILITAFIGSYFLKSDEKSVKKVVAEDSTRYISKTLELFKEDKIATGWAGNQTFRFFWMPSSHSPIMIKVNKNNDCIWVITKKIIVVREKNTIEEKKKSLTKEDWDVLTNKLNEAYFWHLPIIVPESGLDGATWRMEGYVNGRYHQVNIWTPYKGSTKAIGEFLFKLGDVNERIY